MSLERESQGVAAKPSIRRAPVVVRGAFSLAGAVAPAAAARFVATRMFRPRRAGASDAELKPTRQFSIQHRDGQLEVYAWERSAPVVLLVHGWESRAEDLNKFVPKILEAGYSVCAFDAPAHGRSTGTETDVFDFADAIRSVVGAMGSPYAIVAHSLGAAATVIYLNELTSDTPSRLVLLSPAGDLGREISQICAAIGLSSKAQRELRKYAELRLGRFIDACSTSKNLPSIGVAPLIVHDADDRVVPVEVFRDIEDSVRSARMLITSGLGHRGVLRSNDVIAAVVSHLSDQTNRLSVRTDTGP